MLYTSNKKDIKRLSTAKSLLIIAGILATGLVICELLGICWSC